MKYMDHDWLQVRDGFTSETHTCKRCGLMWHLWEVNIPCGTRTRERYEKDGVDGWKSCVKKRLI